MEIVNFSADPKVFLKANIAFDQLHAELSRKFPGARIEHVGSTALLGSLTKGDLDIQIIVDRDGFQRVKAREFEGKSMDDYRNAKEKFFERLKSEPEYQRIGAFSTK